MASTFIMDEPTTKGFGLLLSLATALQTLRYIVPSEYLSQSCGSPISIVSQLTLGLAPEHHFTTRFYLSEEIEISKGGGSARVVYK